MIQKFQPSILATIWIALTAISPAFGEAAPGGLKEGLSPLLPLFLIMGIFYFLIFRPQQKKAKQHTLFLTQLKKGEMVVTQAGIVGTVKNVSDKFVNLEVDEGVVLKILKGHIADSATSLRDEVKKVETAPAT